MYGGIRSILLCLLLTTFTLYVEGGVVAWGLYAIFADQIAAAYCVNPTNPCCHGKCHMRSATEKDRKQGTSAEIAGVKTVLFVAGEILPPLLVGRSCESYRLHDAGGTAAGHPSPIDHPPSSFPFA